MKKEENKTEINKYLNEWTAQDYTLNSRELYDIGVEYAKCKDLADKDLSWQEVDDKGRRINKRKFATEYFQIRNNGMTEDLRVIRLGEFEINRAKLDKYFKWVEFNRTSEQKEEDRKLHQERFNIIGNMIKKLSTNIK